MFKFDFKNNLLEIKHKDTEIKVSGILSIIAVLAALIFIFTR